MSFAYAVSKELEEKFTRAHGERVENGYVAMLPSKKCVLIDHRLVDPIKLMLMIRLSFCKGQQITEDENHEEYSFAEMYLLQGWVLVFCIEQVWFRMQLQYGKIIPVLMCLNREYAQTFMCVFGAAVERMYKNTEESPSE